MDEPSSSDPLHEFVDVEITVRGAENPARQAELSKLLQKFEGIRSLSLAGGKIALTYEPVLVTQHEVLDAIHQAGFETGEVDSSPSSPLSDALEKIVIEDVEVEEGTGEAGHEHER